MNRYGWLGGLFLIAACVGWACAAAEIPVTGKPDARLAAFDEMMRSFMRDHDVPGGALAVARHGKIIYARGFGYADVARHEKVDPDALFRIASVTKPFTGAAINQLIERGKLRLDDHPFELLGLTPHLEGGAVVDPRLRSITVAQLLHHTAGFDRDASFDPMFRPIDIANAFGKRPPARQTEIIEYMMGRPLDFDPGTKEAYSNFGYCVLGRVVEKVSGQAYTSYVTREVLHPLGIRRMRLARSLEKDRAEGEVRYYPHNREPVDAVFPGVGKVPVCYGGWFVEAMDSHGGWIASAPELARFASSFDDEDHCPILKRESIERIYARPKDTGYGRDGKPKAPYYTFGWDVRVYRVNNKPSYTIWHNGLLDGTASLLVRRYDGITWAVLFNADADKDGKYLGGLIDPLVHPVADGIKEWPEGWDFHEPVAKDWQ